MPRTTEGSAHHEDGPLIATPEDPRARNGLTRRGLVLAVILIVALLVVAAGLGVAALSQSQGVSSPSLTPPDPSASADPTPTPTAEAGAEGVVTADLDGQTVWLAAPETDPVGVVVLFPGAADDPSALLESPTAEALRAAGWAVATGDFAGASWGSPASSTDVAALRGWADEQVGPLPTMYVAFEMGGSTSLASMVRTPQTPVACWYGAGTVTDLQTVGTAVPAIGSQIVAAWGEVPSTDEAIVAQIDQLSTDTRYRVVIPGPGAEDLRVQDSQTLISALEQSGHEVTQTTATGTLASSTEIDAADVVAMAEGCLG